MDWQSIGVSIGVICSIMAGTALVTYVIVRYLYWLDNLAARLEKRRRKDV